MKQIKKRAINFIRRIFNNRLTLHRDYCEDYDEIANLKDQKILYLINME